jgi:hypothetical protein
MDQRLKLHEDLKSITNNVYFQPPDNFQMQYPCIVYNRDDIAKRFADNAGYIIRYRYSVTVIDRDVDSPLVALVAALPLCSFSNGFVTDQLYHDVFSVYA